MNNQQLIPHFKGGDIRNLLNWENTINSFPFYSTYTSYNPNKCKCHKCNSTPSTIVHKPGSWFVWCLDCF